ncbi:hypothetical protein D0962_21940 [Leptolyngbyaceae cyanobacterium CCMR0082]|uniref:Tyr recombinase domain-containing protein n=1 Tax=Adonisia turfae CCMR0082 TaxID=2304604 RepID=A0A6M0SAC8_9CYAN|nr:hypothetical protein [Adonisia turfae]NEZ65400.1 hypothetical protein [Adonisia turfae CCMR0082]
MATKDERLKRSIKKASQKFDRVRIERRGDKLSLRATLPPKPGEDKPKQRYLPTGKPVNEAGLKLAISMAMRLEAELIESRFEWKNWDKKIAKVNEPKTVGDWVNELIQRKSAQVNEATLKREYISPLSRLPQGEPLTEMLCKELIEQITKPKSRSRLRYVTAYIQLLQSAGLPQSLRNLLPVGGVVSGRINPDELPNDEQIFEVWNQIKNPGYKILFSRMAVYGLRPHESFKCQISKNKDEPFCKVDDDTKTGSHIAFPWPFDWYEIMEPWSDFVPHLKVERAVWSKYDNERLGNILSTWFLRNKKTVPFTAYMLRHRYACRLAENSIPTGRAASWMGHDISIHTKVYEQALGLQGELEAWRHAQGKS